MKSTLKVLMLAALALCTVLAAAGCGDTPYEAEATSAPAAPEYTLRDLDGWWVRPEGYEPDGISLVDQFLIVAQQDGTGTWEPYDEMGNRLGALPAHMEGNQLCLEMDEVLGNAYFLYMQFPGGDELMAATDEDTYNTVFVKDNHYGEEVEAAISAQASYVGRWYLHGEPDGIYYEITESHYRVTSNSAGSASFEEGSYHLTLATVHVGREMVVEDVPMLDMEGGFVPDNLYPTEDDCMLIADSDFTKYYIREDAIGTPEAERAALRAALLGGSWMHNDGQGTRIGLRLGHPSYFGILKYDDDGYYEVEDFGAWRLDGDSVHLEYDDGSTDIIDLSGFPHALVSENTGMVFEG